MFTTGSKWFFGLAGFALVAALVWGGATAGHEVDMETFTGVLTLGYKGSVGDHLGYTILMGLFGACVFLGAALAAFRDADADEVAGLLGQEAVPAVTAPPRGSYWPVLGAFGAGTTVVGLVTEQPLVILGLAVVVVAAFEWAVSAWSERATTDPVVNRAVRRRVLFPLEAPLIGVIGIAVFVLSVSRILFAVPKLAVYVLFGLVPTVVLVLAFVLSSRARVSRSAIAVLCVVGGLAILAGGVVSAVVGPREIEPHHAEEHGGPSLASPGAPVVVPGAGS